MYVLNGTENINFKYFMDGSSNFHIENKILVKNLGLNIKLIDNFTDK